MNYDYEPSTFYLMYPMYPMYLMYLMYPIYPCTFHLLNLQLI